ncbi:MAG: FtsX-like permease family protein [Actinobacteria bacterium]|nr:MAG: FtsX-like permease family protein [Actinomycetota bacterium]
MTAVYNPTLGFDTGNDASLMNTLAHLPHVTRAESYAGLNVFFGAADGTSLAVENPLGSIDGMFFDQDHVTVTQGRMADPERSDEFVMRAAAAHDLGLHVGDVLPLVAYSMDQSYSPDFDPATAQPFLTLDAKLVGLVVFSDTVVDDDIDAAGTADAVFTPALTAQLTQCCSYLSAIGLRIDDGSRNAAIVEGEIEKVLPPALPRLFHDTSVIKAKAERAIKPETIALGAFGVIAALATLVIASQVIGRQVGASSDEGAILRALGASPATTLLDGIIGIVGAVVIGSLLAAAVAVVLSPLAPIGPIRPVYPSRGIAFDWTVLALGVVVLIVALTSVALTVGHHGAPQRAARRRVRARTRGSRVARAAAASALPASAVAGVGFALEPGHGPDTAPVRAAILGTVVGMVIVVATLTFGASLNTLVSHPALYGWNWDEALNGGANDIPQQQAAQLLDHDPDVAAWSGVYFAAVQIDGQPVPVIGVDPNAPVGPPTLSGHGLDSSNQIVLGATTLAQLHKRVGDSVEVNSGSTSPTSLKIVGTATMPTIGEGVHPTMGSGALLSYELIPASTRNIWRDPVDGPNAIFVRFRRGTDRTAAHGALQAIADALTAPGSLSTIGVLAVQRPAEIVNYHSMRITPLYLGSALAGGAVFALALTLIASVRRRRNDLALLKTFGLTPRQLAAVVAWQSSVAVAIGTVVGVPLGVILGRGLWDVFAGELHAVARPSVPTLSIGLVAIGALVLANVVAAVPGRIAARTPTALLLRAQ